MTKYILTKDFLNNKVGMKLTEDEILLLSPILWKKIEFKTYEDLFIHLIKGLDVSKFHDYEFYENSLFYKDPEGKIIIEISLRTSTAYLNEIIEKEFHDMFNVTIHEIDAFIKDMISKYLNYNITQIKVII